VRWGDHIASLWAAKSGLGQLPSTAITSDRLYSAADNGGSASGKFSQSMSIGPTTGPGYSMSVIITAATLTNALKARQTVLQTALTNLGVT
jgi:hypothetical protein